MKFEEKITKEYFQFKGYDKIVFEPIGNTPPDFLINNSIAVEVRRLNKFHKNKPLEEVEYSFIPKIKKHISSFQNNSEFEKTTIVYLFYNRPVKFDKKLKLEVSKILKTYSENKTSKNKNNEYTISDNLTIGFYEHNEKWESEFEVGGIVDFDSGGNVFKDICESLEIVIPEKELKIEKFKHFYKEWWLVLIDFISLGVSTHMVNRIKDVYVENKSFKKIIFISPIDSKDGKEINYS